MPTPDEILRIFGPDALSFPMSPEKQKALLQGIAAMAKPLSSQVLGISVALMIVSPRNWFEAFLAGQPWPEGK